MFEFSLLKPEDVAWYYGMTYPYYRRFLEKLAREDPARGDQARVLAAKAQLPEQPVGLALAKIDGKLRSGRKIRIADMLSIVTAPKYRRRGIAAELLRLLEREAAARGCHYMQVVYEKNRPSSEALEGLLDRCDYSAPVQRGIVCRTHRDRMKEAPYLQKNLLPAAFEMSLWRDVTDEEKRNIKDTQQIELWYPPELSPFQEEESIELLNSLVLRHRGQIIGWQINHRIFEDTIRYSITFVKEELQPFGLAIPALIEATRRQMESGDPKLHKATFAISLKTPGMIKFMRKYQASYMDEITASVQRVKDLSIGGRSHFRREA